jgi:hypothetical protein
MVAVPSLPPPLSNLSFISTGADWLEDDVPADTLTE